MVDIGEKRGIIRIEVRLMEKKFILKMIKNCFKQYYAEAEILPLNQDDYEELYKRILIVMDEHPDAELYEIVNDSVYEFITR
jgi:hypothetical protein